MKTLILIDGPNIFAQLRSLELRLDYDKLRAAFAIGNIPPRINYYTAEHKDSSGLNKMQSFTDWLQYHGIRLVTKKAIIHQRDGEEVIKGNLDIEMAVDAMACLPWFEKFVLISGDGDFGYLCDYLRQKGKHVIVVASSRCEHGHVNTPLEYLADSLRRSCDEYINLNDVNGPGKHFTSKDKGPLGG